MLVVFFTEKSGKISRWSIEGRHKNTILNFSRFFLDKGNSPYVFNNAKHSPSVTKMQYNHSEQQIIDFATAPFQLFCLHIILMCAQIENNGEHKHGPNLIFFLSTCALDWQCWFK